MKQFAVCQTCGAVFSEDYFREWGRKFGIGLGPVPVCEAMDSNYGSPITYPTQPPAPEKAMHAVGVCRGSIVLREMPDNTETCVLAIDDPYMVTRAKIMQDKQRAKSPALNVILETVHR